jgi:anaerobic magnesium-protoporphyrin IX monomethyl ester cyclase
VQKKKTLLINPPFQSRYSQPPLGLAILAAVLEKNGYPVKILDMPALGFSETVLSKIICQEKPHFVGITATTLTIGSAANIAKKIKKIDDTIVVILGGAHVTIMPIKTMQEIPEIDIVISGEGGQTLLELIKCLEMGGEGISNVAGITYRDDNQIKSTYPRPLLSNLDELPFPSFHLLPLTRYLLHPPFGRRSPAMPIITSRGCPYRCLFCSKSVFGNKYRSNSPDYVINEIRLLNERFGIKEIKFYDDVFTIDRKRVMTICRELKKQKIDILWTCETRVNLVDAELLRTMKDAGCYMIAYGVESGSQQILDKIRKDIKLAEVIKAFKLTHDAGIGTIAYLMIGCPEETTETINATIKFASHLDCDFAQFSIATPYPGTELFDLAIKDGEVSNDWNQYSYDKPFFQTSTLSKNELIRWHRRAHVSFYLRPAYVLKRIKATNSLEELQSNIAGLKMLRELLR